MQLQEAPRLTQNNQKPGKGQGESGRPIRKTHLKLPSVIRRIAIVGSRHYPNMIKVVEFVERLPPEITVVSGGAPGVDTLAVQTAKRRGINTKEHLAEWNKYGKGAGYRRNRFIIIDADVVVVFWDGASKGTKNSIKLARDHNKALYVYGPDGKLLFKDI